MNVRDVNRILNIMNALLSAGGYIDPIIDGSGFGIITDNKYKQTNTEVTKSIISNNTVAGNFGINRASNVISTESEAILDIIKDNSKNINNENEVGITKNIIVDAVELDVKAQKSRIREDGFIELTPEAYKQKLLLDEMLVELKKLEDIVNSQPMFTSFTGLDDEELRRENEKLAAKLKDISDKLNTLRSQNSKVISLYDTVTVANWILNLSKTYCPVDTGRLKESGHIEQGEDGVVRVVYDCPYATWVHEITGFYHKPPTRSKFLEDAAYDIFAYFQRQGYEPFTFEMHTDSTNGIWLDINSISYDVFRANEEAKMMYLQGLINNFEGVIQNG